MKLIIVSIHTLFAFSILLSFSTVESWFGSLSCVDSRRKMAQNDPFMIPTQSKLVEKDDGISFKVVDEKGKVIGSRSSFFKP